MSVGYHGRHNPTYTSHCMTECGDNVANSLRRDRHRSSEILVGNIKFPLTLCFLSQGTKSIPSVRRVPLIFTYALNTYQLCPSICPHCPSFPPWALLQHLHVPLLLCWPWISFIYFYLNGLPLSLITPRSVLIASDKILCGFQLYPTETGWSPTTYLKLHIPLSPYAPLHPQNN